MKKRPAKSAPSPEPVSGPVRICYERIIPESLDSDRRVRRSITSQIMAISNQPPPPEEVERVRRMAIRVSKAWAPGTTVKCRFLDGTPTMKKKVEKYAHAWEKYANLKFKFVATGASEIRISFYADAGSWSALGRDCLNSQYFPLHQPTMNYGWLRDNTSEDECSRVVLHEFGHAMGCIHEHSSPKFDRKWNKAKVMAYFQGPPNFWSPEDIQHNVLSKYSPQGTAATDYDPDSIMLYDFAAALFDDGKGGTNSNTKLSAKDISMIKTMYP